MGRQYSFNFVIFVFFQTGFQRIQRNAFAPFNFMHFHVKTQTFGHFYPQMRKLTKAIDQDFITWI